MKGSYWVLLWNKYWEDENGGGGKESTNMMWLWELYQWTSLCAYETLLNIHITAHSTGITKLKHFTALIRHNIYTGILSRNPEEQISQLSHPENKKRGAKTQIDQPNQLG